MKTQFNQLNEVFDLRGGNCPLDDGDYILSSYTPRQPFKHSEESKLLMKALQVEQRRRQPKASQVIQLKGRKLTDEQRAKVKAARGTADDVLDLITKQKCRDNHPGCRQILLT